MKQKHTKYTDINTNKTSLHDRCIKTVTEFLL